MKVRADILRTYQGVHTWTGIIAGLVLFIGFYAGSLTMFKHEIQQWAEPTTAPLTDPTTTNYQSLVDKAITVYPEQMAKGFELDLLTTAAPLSWYTQGQARGMHLDNQQQTAYLDEDQKLIIADQAEHKLADLIDYLHRTAGFIGEIGHDQSGVYILGIAAGLYFLALVSGVIILLPTLVKTFFALRKEKGPSRFWLDSHNLIGVASLPFHLIIAFTVIVFAFHDLIYDGLAQFYGDKPLFERPPTATHAYNISELKRIDTQILAAKGYATGYEPIHISYSRLNLASPSAVFKMSNDSAVVRGPDTDYLFMNPYTLEISGSTYPQGEESFWGNFVASIFSLHFGTYGGEWGRWAYFIMGLFGALLFYSGNLLWIDKRMKKDANKTGTHIMAKLTIGVCLGSMLAVVAVLLLAKWSNILINNINHHYMQCYYVVFFISLAYCFTLGANKASYTGLITLSILTVCLPISSVIQGLNNLALLPYYESYSVDFIATLFSVMFFFIAKRLKQKPLKDKVILDHKTIEFIR
ncbi:PepSY domain-containing protein [Pseudoalteromonas sp. SG41-5]|uniref:PepSY-associated TM helix domain-containing protein n=1 Tax=Pseudoalteromonas sp. SG41-5 TaxID=2760975 RepID=UPI0016022497|nr:PepSY-associated TM helix domain-containing protein [Pseudoalteromonas sp. SG41-5]MBB1469405.1 PepSY domain-containing protein [Pseudoalteromonas sp. SG41-5]